MNHSIPSGIDINSESWSDHETTVVAVDSDRHFDTKKENNSTEQTGQIQTSTLYSDGWRCLRFQITQIKWI